MIPYVERFSQMSAKVIKIIAIPIVFGLIVLLCLYPEQFLEVIGGVIFSALFILFLASPKAFFQAIIPIAGLGLLVLLFVEPGIAGLFIMFFICIFILHGRPF